MDRNSTKIKLSESLSGIRGYVDKIHSELVSKKDITISRSKISMCLNPKYDTWDNDVIDAAYTLVGSYKENEQDLHEKVSSL